MFTAPHPALSQLTGVMLGMALTVGNMTNAWQEQHLPILHVAISAGAKVTPGTTHTVDTHPVRRSNSATCNHDLILAAQAGNMMVVQSLLAEGASLRVRDADGRTALIAAAMAHTSTAVRLLIQAGVDASLQNNMQNSAFLPSVGQSDVETICLALLHGANPCATNTDGDTALIPAARRGYIEVVSELVKTGVPPDTTNNLDLTTLIEAVVLGDGSDKYGRTVQVLLDGGTDLNLADRGGVASMRHVRQRGFHGTGALPLKARGH